MFSAIFTFSFFIYDTAGQLFQDVSREREACQNIFCNKVFFGHKKIFFVKTKYFFVVVGNGSHNLHTDSWLGMQELFSGLQVGTKIISSYFFSVIS